MAAMYSTLQVPIKEFVASGAGLKRGMKSNGLLTALPHKPGMVREGRAIPCPPGSGG